MERTILNVFWIAEVALIGGFMLLYPRIARKGLLFGVYVGEERSRSEEARSITRAWYRGMVAAIGLALLTGAAIAARPGHPLWMIAPSLALGAAFTALYLIAYARARKLASPAQAAPPSVAAIGVEPEPRPALAWAALLIAVAAGCFVIVDTAARYDALPDPMPTHFGADGRPDGWSPKSFGSVMILPIMTLVMGVMLGGIALLTGRAKRGLRLDAGRSLEAQNRFRAAMSRFLAILGVLVTTMLAMMAFGAVQVALGRREGLPGVAMLIGLAIFLYAMLGSAYLAIRYGQGGARLEGPRVEEPLTDGLADNRCWKLGVFYVNAHDPSWLVEHRFGFGYTLNFGNAKAVATFAAFLAAILGLAAWAALSSS